MFSIDFWLAFDEFVTLASIRIVDITSELTASVCFVSEQTLDYLYVNWQIAIATPYHYSLCWMNPGSSSSPDANSSAAPSKGAWATWKLWCMTSLRKTQIQFSPGFSPEQLVPRDSTDPTNQATHRHNSRRSKDCSLLQLFQKQLADRLYDNLEHFRLNNKHMNHDTIRCVFFIVIV